MLRPLVAWLSVLLGCSTALAHDVRSTLIFLDVGSSKVDVEVQLPVQELQGAFEVPVTWRGPIEEFASREQLERYVQSHLGATSDRGRAFAVQLHDVGLRQVDDGQSVVATLTLVAPPRGSARAFTMHSDLIVHRVVNHNTLVFLRRDALSGSFEQEPELLGMLHYQQKTLRVERAQGSLGRAFRAAFELGTRHIAEGTDHLLFLLALLLPACQLAVGKRWRGASSWQTSTLRTAKVVSAFTLGHSLTLLLGALDLTWLPARPVEILIAVSILVSAIHAARPLFAGYELYLAGAFGLVHGMAFASALQGCAIDGATLASSVLGFNLGIEAMQLAVVSMTLPSLLILSRHERLYAAVRCLGAGLAGVAAVGWIAQRAWERDTPMSAFADGLTAYGPWCILALALAALASLFDVRFTRTSAALAPTGSSAAPDRSRAR